MAEILTLGPEDIQDLKRELIACDKETQKFIQPLLGVPCVQHMLIAFMKDKTMNFQDWIWEPKAHSRLSLLRDSDLNALKANLSDQYAQKLGDLDTERVKLNVPRQPEKVAAAALAASLGATKETPETEEQAPSHQTGEAEQDAPPLPASGPDYYEDFAEEVYTAVPPPSGSVPHYYEEFAEEEESEEAKAADDFTVQTMIVAADAKRLAAKERFDNGDFRAAYEGFLVAGSMVENVEGSTAARRDARAMCSRCLCNGAISAFKQKRYSEACDAATRALAASDDGLCAKALYWRVKGKLAMSLYDAAKVDLELLKTADPSLGSIPALEKQIDDGLKTAEAGRSKALEFAEQQAKVAQEEAEKEEKEAAEWDPPKPPHVRDLNRTPFQILHEYGTKHKFIPVIELEGGMEGHSCRITIPGRCGISVDVEESSSKAAKQKAAAEVLKACGVYWNERHPEDPVNMLLMEYTPPAAPEHREPDLATAIETVPPTYSEGWVKVVAECRNNIQRVIFPLTLTAVERALIHTATLDEDKAGTGKRVISKSFPSVENPKLRQLSVMTRELWEKKGAVDGMVFTAPGPPTAASEVDLTEGLVPSAPFPKKAPPAPKSVIPEVLWGQGAEQPAYQRQATGFQPEPIPGPQPGVQQMEVGGTTYYNTTA